MKILRIAFKDLTVAFRDRTGLLLMLAAPVVLTFGMALVSGRMTGSSGPTLADIPVIVVNRDDGEIGQMLVEAFSSDALAGLLDVGILQDAAAARTEVDQNRAAAAVVVPAGFTEAIVGGQAPDVRIEVYANPEREVSAQVVTAVVESFVQQIELGRVSGQVAVEHMLAAGLIAPAQAQDIGMRVGAQAADVDSGATLRLVSTEDSVSAEVEFDPMSYFAPSMAIFFLMFTVSLGGKSLLDEKSTGTLGRLSSAPIGEAAILAGKMLGIYLTALAQMTILIAVNALVFGVTFGDGLAVFALVAALAAAATGWGILLAALARTPSQVTTMGSAMMLTFGVLGGNFVSITGMPEWFRWIARITPNAWGLDGFVALGLGDGLPQIAGTLAALLVMAALLFLASVWLLRRRGVLHG
ncbi:MAG: ABC transporter permease [Anaerolineales bacterium]|nr:ABC transporter permease [Anaerolineales bacterium]